MKIPRERCDEHSVPLGITSQVDQPMEEHYGATRPPRLQYQMGGCGIAGCMDLSGGRLSGDKIAKMLETMGQVTDEDIAELETALQEFEKAFEQAVLRDWENWVKVQPTSSRPFSGHYDPTCV